MKTQAEVDHIRVKSKLRYRDALVRFQTKHLDFRLLAGGAVEALHGNNREDAEAIQQEPQEAANAAQANQDGLNAVEATATEREPAYSNVA